MTKRLTRRRFLHTAAVAGTTPFWSGLLLADDKKAGAANEKLHVGVIGVGGQGNHDWRNVHAAGAEIVAFCDVDENRDQVVKARNDFPKANFYPDFRKLVEQKDLDAVVVATPDHTHAPATLAALRSGLHVFCEKPLTHTVEEARLVAETAAKQKRVTQMGTQIHNTGGNYRRVVELIQSGAIGQVGEVHVWCGAQYHADARPKETPPVPPGLNWDLWVGPAPMRPYHPGYVPFYWRRWWDFGGAALADMACHYTDLPFWALKLRHPTKIAAEGPPVHPEAGPLWCIVHYEFPERDGLPPVKLTWYDGGKKPTALAENQLPPWGNGVLFIGAKGMLMADYGQHKLFPEKQFAGFTPPKPTIPESVGHYKEWVEACKTGAVTTCNFDYAGALTETVLLGNVSYRLGRPITWDAKNLKAVNDAEAERFVRKEYRKGWGL